MKFIFLGDIEFGRDKDRHCSLFLSKDIIQLLNSNDAIFFNLETVLVSKDFSLKDNYLKHKDIHIYSYGESDLQYIKKHIHKPIFVSTINNHTFDYDVKGYYNTLKLLDTYNYKFTIEKSYYIDSQIIYLNATDHWTIIEYNREKYPENANIWNKHCLLIDNKQKEEYTYKLIQYLNSIKQSRILIFSVHWGKNFQNNNEKTTYLSNHIYTFF
jgi:Bacterial capsule synthesis protein PGA_cap.